MPDLPVAGGAGLKRLTGHGKALSYPRAGGLLPRVISIELAAPPAYNSTVSGGALPQAVAPGTRYRVPVRVNRGGLNGKQERHCHFQVTRCKVQGGFFT
jgi:hypothetical protein